MAFNGSAVTLLPSDWNFNMYGGGAISALADLHPAAQRHGAFSNGGRHELDAGRRFAGILDQYRQGMCITNECHAALAGGGVLADIAHAFIDDLEYFRCQPVAEIKRAVR